MVDNLSALSVNEPWYRFIENIFQVYICSQVSRLPVKVSRVQILHKKTCGDETRRHPTTHFIVGKQFVYIEFNFKSDCLRQISKAYINVCKEYVLRTVVGSEGRNLISGVEARSVCAPRSSAHRPINEIIISTNSQTVALLNIIL